MPAPHAFYSKMLAERTASRNVFALFYFILLYFIYYRVQRATKTKVGYCKKVQVGVYRFRKYK